MHIAALVRIFICSLLSDILTMSNYNYYYDYNYYCYYNYYYYY